MKLFNWGSVWFSDFEFIHWYIFYFHYIALFRFSGMISFWILEYLAYFGCQFQLFIRGFSSIFFSSTLCLILGILLFFLENYIEFLWEILGVVLVLRKMFWTEIVPWTPQYIFSWSTLLLLLLSNMFPMNNIFRKIMGCRS